MNEPFSDELLSAYLDGELPLEERSRVEDWLTASAEHRRLLDDLKAIRRELQALPKQSLDAGFSDRVLAAIRQRSGEQAGSSPDARGSSSSAESAETIPIKPANLPDRHLGMPAWRWFAAGVAATLLAVIVGMNAAPQTMAQIGRLAQVVQPNREIPTKKEAASARGYAATPAPGEERPVTLEGSELAGSGSGARQREPSIFAKATNKDMGETFPDGAQMRKEAVPGEQVAGPQVEVPAPSAPKVEADAVPAARAALESFDKKNADIDGRENLASETEQSVPGDIANGQAAVAYGDVIELPVTGEQANRALAFYARTVGQQAARRYSNSTVATLATPSADEQESDRFAESSDRETVLERSGPGLALMKLMDAATQGVQVAALDVTGPEAEVQALLDSLGVDQARDLRPRGELFAGGAGGVSAAFRATREGEQSAAGGSEATPATAAGKVVAKADSASNKTEEAKGGITAPKSASRSRANGGVPLVKLRGVYEGKEGASDQAKQSPASQHGADVPSPQLRVRLVFVPAQTDPIGPTIEVKPAD